MKTFLIPVRRQRIGRSVAGFIDLRQCTFIADKLGCNRGDAFEWESLIRTPAGRFLVYIDFEKTEPPGETLERYAVFITELEAIGWFADYPESAPEGMRPLFEKFDLTEAPAAPLEPAAAPSPSKNGRAPSGNRTAAANGRAPRALPVKGCLLPHRLLKVPTGRVYIVDDALGVEPVDLDGCRVYRLADHAIDKNGEYRDCSIILGRFCGPLNVN